MDKNSIIGLVVIAGILIGWMLLMKPSEAEIARQQQIRDSIAQVEALAEQAKADALAATNSIVTDSVITLSDSAQTAILQNKFGAFATTAIGENKTITLENELMKVSVLSKGGRIGSVELKEYKTFDGRPLILFTPDSSAQNLQFTAYSKEFTTDSLYFTTETAGFTIADTNSKSLVLRAYAGSKEKYIEYVYTLTGNQYMMGFRVNVVGLQDIIASNTSAIKLNWYMKTPKQEQHNQTQSTASTIFFKSPDENVDKISETSEERKILETPVKWVGFKQQFFSAAIIADNTFDKSSEIETKNLASNDYIKAYTASLNIPYKHTSAETFGMRLYFGPNHFKTLKQYDLDLEYQISLGWKIFGWVNRFLTIPIFNFLDGFNLNYGIIILILTIIIKILLLPIAYKTVLSSAKMRVLKPEVDELNEKFKNDDPIKKQQATMALYKQAGVNPMAGCIPVLLQMPILIALFSFFPASIELRQQSFLWATDLSTYDSVYDFGFSVPFYGDHVSLFALLMTASTLLYTWSNSQLMGTSNQMPGMKWMMYLMPIIFLGFLNNYSAGLSWYYFLANMITFGQTWIMQKFVIDSDALHAKIQENKKKPVQASKFQQRLEQMVKENQQRQQKKK